jgi:carbonic anhydrase
MNTIAAFAILTIVTAPTLNAAYWSYHEADLHGPRHWQEHYPDCGGTAQTPIDIRSSKAHYDHKYTNLRYIGYDKKPAQPFRLKNNGHSVQVTTNLNNIRVKGGGLQGEYVLEQLHFHWGANDNVGSEHHLNGREYPAEVHFVHRKSKYDDIADALDDPEGLAVLGVFLEVTDEEREVNETLKKLIGQFIKVKLNGVSTDIEQFPLHGLLPQSPNYYRYSGSLTTPPCAQSVVWTVFKEPIKITSRLLEAFRRLHETAGKELLHNYRPLQPLNGRTVYTNIKSHHH